MLFALTYLRTTETFLRILDEGGYDDSATVIQDDVVIQDDTLFAEYYFRSYDAYYTRVGNVPPACKEAFGAAQSRSVSDPGNLILGSNAHLQRDLPFVFYELYLQGHPVSYKDHTRANKFLQKVNAVVDLTQRFDPTIDNGGQAG